MKSYFVGLAMRTRLHDYTRVYSALISMRARRASDRIWLCEVHEGRADDIFAYLGDCLADEDEMLVCEAPAARRPVAADVRRAA